EELLLVELGEVGAQRARQAAGLARLRVPEQHGLAGRDLDDLDVILAALAGQERGLAAALGHDQLVGAVGPHAIAASSDPKTPSPTCSAGTLRTPAARASAVSASSRSRVERSSAPLISAAG